MSKGIKFWAEKVPQKREKLEKSHFIPVIYVGVWTYLVASENKISLQMY